MTLVPFALPVVVFVLLAVPLRGGQDPKPATPPVPPWVVPPGKKQPFLEHHTFHSDSMNVDVGYNIYLPPGYAESGDRKYPVIFWLHGFTCHESNDQFPAAQLDQAIRDGKIPPLLFCYGNGGSRAFYSDSSDGKILSETMIIKEYIPYIERSWRGMGTREGRALQGMSMGGHGALKLAFTYPEMFSSVVAYAGGFLDEDEMERRHPDVVQQMFGGDKGKFTPNMPATIVRKNLDRIRGKLPVKMVVGTKDFLLEHNRRIHALLGELGVDHEYAEVDGINHNLPGLANEKGVETLEFAAKAFGPSK
jgi:endo-1,4-beta-xylanase